MYIAMNRFKVQKGSEEAFENLWKNRDSRLSKMQGFREFHLLRGPANEAEGYTLFASHAVWDSHEDFVAWTKSQEFVDGHARTDRLPEGTFTQHPTLEIHEVFQQTKWPGAWRTDEAEAAS